MSDEKRDHTDNLEFFEAAILGAAPVNDQGFISFESSISSDFGVIEAAHWAWLGVQIGYFDGEDAYELLSSSKDLFRAWSNLLDREIISPEEDWASVIRLGGRGQPALNKKLFSVAVEIAPQTREFLQNTFQTFLLLNAENIMEGDSQYFLDSIGWTSDEKWNACREGMAHRLQGAVQEIGAGFANVLNYWDEMESSSWNVNPDGVRYIFDWGDSIGFTKGLAHEPVFPNFIRDVRAIMSRRFNLDRIEIVDRYFALAGEFTQRAVENSPAWLDARLKVFDQMHRLIKYVGGTTKGRKRQLWSVFTKSIESSPAENEVKPAKKRSRDKDRELPESFL